ncbi:MAG: bifunctional 4-hydroxy-2-oxoglutarate aldolase/2-dehydro-3-deoxy-phosphogluconate aldolase [Defluviitaleaceae bacterium]|nr:bifunctional 4-hydroxy-2-oxoglutarate aldolase/2-dehydro-3-deoxy-phosphogluconate aldolase [Defluviitaleaceae bacterium]
MVMTPQDILNHKLIAIVRGMEADKILPFTEALYNGGFRMIEVTFNLREPDSPATPDAIKAISDRFGKDMWVGAGTVVNQKLVDKACEAGARYIVSPNTDMLVIARTKDCDMISIPGAYTPSECMDAHKAGADFVKLFPASSPEYLKAIKAPLSHLHFVATGGISEKNIPAFLDAGASGFGVGGNLANKDWIDAGEFNKITELAKAYVQAAKS